ncbi:MAG TPA: YggT family protein [Blastocatellia bacterium]|nr:YggT family protein [Blastocatellia bacterium]
MSNNEGGETSTVLLDEERRQASHQEVKASIDDDVNARIRRESERVEPKESAEVAGVAHELKQKSVHEAVETEREIGRGRAAARISQVVDYCFYIIYGLIALQFLLKLMGARPGNGFVQFVGLVSRPILAPFERIVPTPSNGSFHMELSYLLALVVYILIHFAINGAFRLVAHRKVTV